MCSKLLAFLVAGVLSAPMTVSAAPTVSPLGGDQFQISVDSISFDVITAGEVSAIVFEDFYASNSLSCGTYVGGTVQVSLNGGALQALIGNTCTGAYNALNEVDGNDLLVTFVEGFRNTFGTVSVGDTFAVASASNYVFSLGGLNPTANAGPFDAFLVNNRFERVSNVVRMSAAPEPGTLALLGLGLAGLAATRRRKQ